jgi:thiamine transport system permease protein
VERRRSRLALLGLAPAVFVGLFFGWPVAAIVARGLSGGGLSDVLGDVTLRRVAWFTIWQALLSTAFAVVLGLPLAFVLARYRFRGRSLVESLLVVPFVLPTVVVGAAFLALLNGEQSVRGVLLAHVFFNVPVVVRTVTPLWRKLDPRFADAARTLGAGRVQVWRNVTLPLLRQSVLAAAGIVFLFTFTSFGVVLLLGGPRRRTLEVEIYQRTAQQLDLRSAAALALVQLVALGGLLLLSSRNQARAAVRQRLADHSQPARLVVLAPVLLTALALFGLPLFALTRRAGQWSSALGTVGRAALVMSLRTALIAALVATILGAMAGIVIARQGRVSRWLDAGLMLPLGTSAVTVGFGLLITFDLRGSAVIVPIAHALIGLPFVVRSVVPVLRSIDPRQRDAAAMLGATPAQTWWSIDAPLLRRGLLTGLAFAFAISLGEFGATSFLIRRGNPTLPTLIGDLLGKPGVANNQQAYALAVILAVVTAVVMVLVDALNSRVAA